MANLALDTQKDLAYDFYKKYLWKELSENGEQESGWILRTIYRQFGNWCVKKNIVLMEMTKSQNYFGLKKLLNFCVMKIRALRC